MRQIMQYDSSRIVLFYLWGGCYLSDQFYVKEISPHPVTEKKQAGRDQVDQGTVLRVHQSS